MKTIVGVDVGKTGAIAVIQGEDCKALWDMPVSDNGRIDVIALWGYCHLIGAFYGGGEKADCFIENVHTMPGQGVSSSGKFMRTFGNIEAVFACSGFNVKYVEPRIWKKRFWDTKAENKTEAKDRSLSMARRLFPEKKAELKLAKHHNRAEALLIAEFGNNAEG